MSKPGPRPTDERRALLEAQSLVAPETMGLVDHGLNCGPGCPVDAIVADALADLDQQHVEDLPDYFITLRWANAGGRGRWVRMR